MLTPGKTQCANASSKESFDFSGMGMNKFKGTAHSFVHCSLSSAHSPKNSFLGPLEVTGKVLCWPEPAFACVTGRCGKCHVSVKPLRTKW